MLVNFGELDFADRVTAKASLAIWRDSTTRKPLTCEYSYQIKIGAEGLHEKVKDLSEQFFLTLQRSAADWLAPGTTKTSAIYELGETAVIHH